MRNPIQINKLAMAALLGAGFWLVQPALANADVGVSLRLGGHDYDRHDNHHWSGWNRHRYHHYYPHNFVRLDFGPRPYYYAEGYYYQGDPDNYVVVTPPSGVVIRTLPVGFQRFVVSGRVFYSYNGVYYERCYEGYKVVPAPYADTVQVVPAASTYPVDTADSNEVSINIPNNRGGYTVVTLKRSGNGFVGPQGELYNEFPSVEKLKVVYGGR